MNSTAYCSGSRVTDWKRAIGVLILIHQHIKDVDQEGIWANELPRVAALPDTLTKVKSVLSEKLDERYKEFLACADGWPAFYQWVDLFGTSELLGARMEIARGRLRELARRSVLAQSGYFEEDLLVIAMTRAGEGNEDPDLFALVRSQQAGSGQVLWFGADETDRFADFDSFFLAMLDYNREEVQDLVKDTRDRDRSM